jgi:hypothetical protein
LSVGKISSGWSNGIFNSLFTIPKLAAGLVAPKYILIKCWVFLTISFYERKKSMFTQNLFGIWDVLLSLFVGTLFSVAELIGGKMDVKIGGGGGAR